MKLQPDKFELETNTIWSFPDRGNWATHDAKYRGNWSPYIPRNIILRYSEKGDTVLDQFVGGGTTLVEAKLLERNALGIDINENAIARTKEKCNFEYGTSDIQVKLGDARKLELTNESIDLVCTHPPYANIIQYSENIEGDLSHCNMKAFLSEIFVVAEESYRVLKKGKYCAILMGDMRIKGMVQPLAFETMRMFELAGFKLKEIIVKIQHNCQATGFWKTNSIKHNFLLLGHENLFIFKK